LNLLLRLETIASPIPWAYYVLFREGTRGKKKTADKGLEPSRINETTVWEEGFKSLKIWYKRAYQAEKSVEDLASGRVNGITGVLTMAKVRIAALRQAADRKTGSWNFPSTIKFGSGHRLTGKKNTFYERGKWENNTTERPKPRKHRMFPPNSTTDRRSWKKQFVLKEKTASV